MGVRQKTLLITGLTLAGLIIILSATSRVILLRSYAEWDDTYAFMADGKPDYVKSNYPNETFAIMRINFLFLVDTSGAIVFSRGLDLVSNGEIPIPPSLQAQLSKDSLLVRHPLAGKSISGVLRLLEGPLLIASNPILPTDSQGPVRGAMIMGRYLDAAQIKHLAKITRLSFSLHSLNDAIMLPGLPAPRNSWRPEDTTIIVHPLHADSIAEVSHIGASGDHALRATVSGKDELSHLASAINTMLDSLQLSQEELRNLSAHLEFLREEERAAMAREIHDEFTKKTGIPCRLSINDENDLKLTREISNALFRVLQETLTNIIRHAGANQTSVHLEKMNEHVVLKVRDNGKGMTQKEMTVPRSFGLVGMRKRIHRLKGYLKIVSNPRQGTTIIASVPWQ